MTEIAITPYSADDHDWLVARHAELYAQAEGFDDSFGPLVSGILRSFETSYDPSCEAGWIARQTGLDGAVRLGSIFCVRLDTQTAKLRLFLLEPDARGQGLGARLLQVCMDFARNCGYVRMSLWTHASHTAACALYERSGWRCTSSVPVHSFGVDLIEQQWEIDL